MTDKKTDEVLLSMLVERVPHSFLDSGGAYGYQHDRNEKRDLPNEPAAKLRFRPEHKEIEFSVSLFHYLKDRLEYTDQMNSLYAIFSEMYEQVIHSPGLEYNANDYDSNYQREFLRFLNLASKTELGDDKHFKVNWLEREGEILNEIVACHLDDFFYEDNDDGIVLTLGKGKASKSEMGSGYTYNGESSIDQDFVWNSFEFNGEEYTFLMIHGGCDARGGFTRDVIFKVAVYGFPYDVADGSIFCNGCNRHWDTDTGGYRFFPEERGEPNLGDFEMMNEEEYADFLANFENEHRAELDAWEAYQAGQQILLGEPPVKPASADGVIRVDEDGNGYCPYCSGLLQASVPYAD